MGRIIKKRVEYGGSSNSSENIKYDDTKNVKEAIDEVKSDIATTNSNLSTNFPTAWNYPILSSCMINEFDYTYGNEVAQRDAILKLSTNTHESFTYLGLRTALINYSNGKEMILYSGNGDRYGGGIVLSNISQKFFKAEKDDITFFDIDSINSNFSKIPHPIEVASGYSAYASIIRQNCWRTKDFLYLNFALNITNCNAIEQNMALIELNLHAHGMSDILAFSYANSNLIEFYTSDTSLCVNVQPTENIAYFVTGVIPINSL